MPLIRYVAQLLGWLMNGIYWVLDKIRIPNIGLAIILFTVILYILMWPLQVKQQKSAKIMAAVQPELQKIQKKYQGKRDQASQMKMQEETMALYRQYGTSPTGSCGTLLIQMPLLFGLYQVIYHIPGYVTKVRGIFDALASKITQVAGSTDIIKGFITDNSVRMMSRISDTVTKTDVIDFLYALKPAQWAKLKEVGAFSGLVDQMNTTQAVTSKINSFMGINISESPMDVIASTKGNLASGLPKGVVIGALIVAILIPVLAWFTQWLNYKLMPKTGAAESATMKSMNLIMPIFSAVLCISFSMGIGIYWIVGAIVRSVQQVIINRKIGKLDPEALRKEAQEKQQKKIERQKDYERNITKQAKFTAREDKTADAADAPDAYDTAKEADPNSILAKAYMVRSYEERTGDTPGSRKGKGGKGKKKK